MPRIKAGVAAADAPEQVKVARLTTVAEGDDPLALEFLRTAHDRQREG